MSSDSPDICGNRFHMHEILVERPNCRVYRASDARLSFRDVAVKIFSDRPDEDPHWRASFEFQVHKLRRASHPSLCPIIQAGEDGGSFYMAMERLEGPTVKQYLEDNGCVFEVEQALELITEVAQGLQEIHEQGLYHGHIDLRALMFKNEILCLAGYYPQALTDMRAARGAADRSLAEAVYAAPEQLRGDACDQRVDVYALSAVLYELLTGRPAFAAGEKQITKMLRLKQVPPSPQSAAKHISKPIAQAIAAGLADDREDRCRTMPEFIDAINGGRRSVKNPLVGLAALEAERSDNENMELALSMSRLNRLLIERIRGDQPDRISNEASFEDHLGRSYLHGSSGSETNGVQKSRVIVESSGACLADCVEFMDTMFRRISGQIRRRKLECGEALLIPSCSRVNTFFRSDPIDVVFCTDNGVILDTACRLQPWRLSRRLSGAAFALELPPGLIEQAGLFTGDRLIFN